MSQQINLFNPIFMKQRKYFSLSAMLQALGLIVVGSLLFYGYASYQVKQLGTQAAEGAQRLDAQQSLVSGKDVDRSLQQESQQLQDQIQPLEKKMAERADMVAAFKSGALGNSTGYSEYMRAFSRQVIDGLWLTGFKVVGDATQISLSGGVVNPELLPAYIQGLGREKIMRGKVFSSLQMQQPKEEEQPKTGAVPEVDKKPATPHYIEFTLNSTPDDGGKK